MASSFTPLYDAKSSAFKITRLIYVHCVSKEDFSVHLKGFSCAALMCKEIHFSYLESMSKRRVCLLPKFIEDGSVEELFSGVSSPALIRMNSSCDITVSIYSYSFSRIVNLNQLVRLVGLRDSCACQQQCAHRFTFNLPSSFLYIVC